VTLLATSVAFALGSTDLLNSVKWFSAFACLNALMIMVLMLTLFISLFVSAWLLKVAAALHMNKHVSALLCSGAD
jgi:hypothetical protein